MNAEEYFYNGLKLEKDYKYSEAIDCYKKSIEIEPKENTYLRLADAYRIIKDYNSALNNFREVLKNNNSIYATIGIGCIYLDNKDYKNAIVYFDKVIYLVKELNIKDEHNNLQNAYYNKGLCYYFLEEYDKSLEYFDKAIDLKDDDYNAFNDKGNVYYKQGKLNEAIDCYKKAININSKFSDAYNNLGVIYREKKRLCFIK